MATMNFKEGIRHTSSHSVIAAVGDEPFFRDQIRNKVTTENKSAEVIKVDCDEVEEPLIFDMLRSHDLFSGKRVYVLYNFNKIKKLNSFTEDKFPNIVILDTEKPSKSKQFEELKKGILYIDCNKPKVWEEESDAVSRILGLFKNKGFSITEDTATFLFNRTGYNLYRIVNEMQKVILFKGDSPDKEITEEIIAAICCPGLNVNIFDIIDRILDEKKKEALLLLEDALRKDPSSSILFLSLWYTHFENILFLKTTHRKEEELAQFMRMPPSIIRKKLIPQASKISLEAIIKSMAQLMDADLKLRRGYFDTKFYLENFVITFSKQALQ